MRLNMDQSCSPVQNPLHYMATSMYHYMENIPVMTPHKSITLTKLSLHDQMMFACIHTET